jgi:hypothetical protein
LKLGAAQPRSRRLPSPRGARSRRWQASRPWLCQKEPASRLRKPFLEPRRIPTELDDELSIGLRACQDVKDIRRPGIVQAGTKLAGGSQVACYPADCSPVAGLPLLPQCPQPGVVSNPGAENPGDYCGALMELSDDVGSDRQLAVDLGLRQHLLDGGRRRPSGTLTSRRHEECPAEVAGHSSRLTVRLDPYMRGKQVSPPAPFRRVPFGRRWDVTTQTAGVNPASPVTFLLLFPPACGEGGEGVSPPDSPYFPTKLLFDCGCLWCQMLGNI